MEPFRAVTFRTEHPPQPVAGHHVLMAFADDATAVAWHDWWNVVGAEDFARWLKQQQQVTQSSTGS